MNRFYETTFDNVLVPRENMLGRENEGWYVTTTTLNFERSGIVRIGALKRWFDELVAYLSNRGSGFNLTGGAGGSSARSSGAEAPDLRVERAQTRQRLAGHAIEIEVGRWLAYRVAWMQDQKLAPTYEASASKTYATEISQRFANTAVNVLGLGGCLEQFSPRAPVDGRLSFMYQLTVTGASLRDQRDQRNIIAQRGLGLPRD
jgi:alkylation response protein AidB-like acyl-CoA dehydrogenase